MNKKTAMVVLVTAVVVLVIGPKLRSTVPGLNKLPTV